MLSDGTLVCAASGKVIVDFGSKKTPGFSTIILPETAHLPE